MEDHEKGYQQDEWKIALRTEIITSITGELEERERAYTEVGYYYQCFAPVSLYKYYSDAQIHLNSIRNNQMWYSAPCNFNDVFDCDISVDEQKVFSEALKLFSDKRGIRPGSKVWKDFQKMMKQQIKILQMEFDRLKETTGVACLSESEDSLLMWAHYANNHSGICVEYALLAINQILGFTAVPIIYSEERTCFDFFAPRSIEKDIRKLLIQSLTSKSREWNYEKEWRIIQDQGACGTQWDTNKKGALLTMIQPSSIILGCMAKSGFEQEVKDYCIANKINLYRMEKDPKQYRLNKKVVLEFDKE